MCSWAWKIDRWMKMTDRKTRQMDKQDSLCCTVEAYIHFISLIHKTKPFTLRYCWCCNSTRSFTMAIWERVQEMKSLWLKTKKHMNPHESILFLHLFFCFKINIWFLDEFVKYLLNSRPTHCHVNIGTWGHFQRQLFLSFSCGQSKNSTSNFLESL